MREEKEHREGKIARERKSESTVSREDEEAAGAARFPALVPVTGVDLREPTTVARPRTRRSPVA